MSAGGDPAPSPTVRAPATSKPTPYVASDARPVAGAAFRADEGSKASIGVESPLDVERVLGDDAWSFAYGVTLGPQVGGTVLGWNPLAVYLIDVATGQPRHSLPVPQRDPPRVVLGAATDGKQVAALLSDGMIVYWASLRAKPVEHAPPMRPQTKNSGVKPLTAGKTEVAQLEKLLEASQRRIAFSADGTRLIAGDQIYKSRDFRPLLAIAEGEIVIDADESGAVVAAIEIVRRHGEPGALCGYSPSWNEAQVTALEWRPVSGRVVPFSAKQPGLPVRASARDRWVAFANEQVSHDLITGAERPLPAAASSVPTGRVVNDGAISSIDITDEGTVVLVRQGGAFVVRSAAVTPLAVPTEGNRPPSFESAVLGSGGVPYAVVAFRGLGWTLAEPDPSGGGRVWPAAGLTQRISREGRAVVTLDSGELRVRGFTGDEAEVPFRASNLVSIDQARVAHDRVVVHDVERGANLFAVVDRGSEPRTIRVPGGMAADRWEVSADGSLLATLTGRQLTVVSLDTGHTTRTAALDVAPSALAISRSITAVGTLDGRVRVWACGREAVVDLRQRSDLAHSLAISPDERRLAIGTNRGIAIILQVDCAGSSAGA